MDTITFLAMFPEFGDLSQQQVGVTITQAITETGNYSGLRDLGLQQQAIGLYVAHLLMWSRLQTRGYTAAVSKIASNNDSVEFAINPNTGLSLESTMYGARLQNLLRQYNTILAVC